MDKKELDELFNKSFEVNVRLAGEYSVIAVAGVLLGQAMRLYKTVLSEDEFNRMMETIQDTSADVKPYEAESLDVDTTLH
jgi:hypothetical protein